MVSKKQIAEIESVIGQMTLQELIALRQGLSEQISAKQEEERDRFVSEMKERAVQLGFNLGEMGQLFGFSQGPTRARRGNSGANDRASPKAKYRDPSTGATWSGRGRMAGWLAFHVDEGLSKGVSKEKTLDRYLIKE